MSLDNNIKSVDENGIHSTIEEELNFVTFIHKLYREKKIPRYNYLREAIKLSYHLNEYKISAFVKKFLFNKIQDTELKIINDIIFSNDSLEIGLSKLLILCKAWDSGFLIPKFNNERNDKTANIIFDKINSFRIEAHRKPYILPLLLKLSKSISKEEAYYLLAKVFLSCSNGFYRDRTEKEMLSTYINEIGNYLLNTDFCVFKNRIGDIFLHSKGNKERASKDKPFKKPFKKNRQFNRNKR